MNFPDFNDRLLSLSASQRQLLLRRCHESGEGIHQLPMAKCPRKPDETAPATAAQERLWVLEQLDQGSRFNRIHVALKLEGPVTEDALRKAVDDLVVRHEALRTNFLQQDGSLRQIIREPSPAAFSVRDLSGNPGSGEVDRAVAEEQAAFSRQPFDLRHGQLFRVLLIRLSDRLHLLFVAMHHMIADGWSVDVIAKELSIAYRARLRDEAPAWSRPAAQFADYAVWEQDLRSAGIFDADIEFFRNELAGAPGETTVLPDYRIAARRSEEAGIERGMIDNATLSALDQLAQEHNATLFAVLLAATAILFTRWCDQPDLVFGVVMANRERADAQETVGPLLNVLPLRIRVNEDASFSRLIQDTAAALAHLLGRQGVPFQEIVAALRPPSSAGRTPFFQCLFILQNANDSSLDFPGVDAVELPSSVAGALYDQAFVWRRDAGGLRLDVEYACDLYQRPTIRNLIETLCGSLAQVWRAVHSPAAAFMRPEPAAFSHLDRTAPAFRLTETPIEAFDRWAKAAPEALAIAMPGLSLTYAELARRVDGVAEALRKAGLPRGGSVAVMVASGLAAAVAMLAVNRAGGCFIMLDSSAGKEHLAHVLSDTQPAVCLCEESIGPVPEAAPQDSRSMVVLDSAGKVAGIAQGSAVRSTPRLSGCAYIAYTSGSTGRPKGIMFSHQSFRQFLDWQEKTFAFGPGVRVGMWAPFVFDACYTEVYGALASGATLCIPDYARRHDPNYIFSWLDEQKVDYYLTIPSFLELLVTALEQRHRRLDRIRSVAVSGEVLHAELANRFRAFFSHARLHNLYGPTEAILATHHVIEDGLDPRGSVPVGKPFSGREILLLDRNRKPVPPGTLGEICIVSDYLADGYLNLPEETALRFLAWPAAGRERRLYRTGDYGRIAPDGVLCFLGRRDRQVKIQGCRVELEQVEAALRLHPLVEECAVADFPRDGSNKLLVGYVAGAAVGSLSELRTFLLERLPAYAVPSFFVPLQSMPRTATGKIDRRALPVPSFSPMVSAHSGANTEVERRIREIWTILLGIPAVENKGFFEAGGNSILAVKLYQALDKEFPGRLSLVDVFANPMISDLAEKISAPDGATGKAVAAGRKRARLRQMSAKASSTRDSEVRS